MQTRLQPILDLLDEGLRLYRQGFVSFTLMAALGLGPFVVGGGLMLAATPYLGADAVTLLLLGGVLLGLPLVFYLIAAMSRATMALQQGQPVHIREVLRIGPLRVAGMGCYGVIFTIVANMLTSVLGVLICCPLYLFIGFAMAGVSGVGAAFGATLIIVMLLSIVLIYGLSLVISGATYSGLIYGLQPFAHGDLSFGAAFQRSLDLLFYHFGRNLLAFVLASAIFSALAVAVTIAIGTLLPLPLFWTLGGESPITQGISASAWLLGLLLVLPPLPIWMTLLYQRNLAARQGDDLAAQIAALPVSLAPETEGKALDSC